MTETVEEEAKRRFAWAYPPHSDREDEHRVRQGKGKRDWSLTRQKAIEQVKRERAND